MHQFVLSGLSPFSINAMYYKGNFGKTAAAKDWTYQVFHALNTKENLAKLQTLREAFDSKLHCHYVAMWAVYPNKELYTKAGGVSARTQDCSNWEKPLLDCLFLPKYFIEPAPYGCKNLNTDDRSVVQLLSAKVEGPRALVINIQIKKISDRPITLPNLAAYQE